MIEPGIVIEISLAARAEELEQTDNVRPRLRILGLPDLYLFPIPAANFFSYGPSS